MNINTGNVGGAGSASSGEPLAQKPAKDGKIEGHSVKYRERIDDRLENVVDQLEYLMESKLSSPELKKDLDNSIKAVNGFKTEKNLKTLGKVIKQFDKLDKHDDKEFAQGKTVGSERHGSVHKLVGEAKAELEKYKALEKFLSPANKKMMNDFQKNETQYLLKKHQNDSWGTTWITDIHKEEGKHIEGAFEHLETRVKTPGRDQIPIILGGMELRKFATVEDKVTKQTTEGLVKSFGSLHQPGKLEAKSGDKDMESRQRLGGQGGVLETSEFSMSFNVISVLVPSVFTGEPIYYAREGDDAIGANFWERSVTSEGKISTGNPDKNVLDVIRETDDKYPDNLGLPNVKAKELMFLLKSGFKPEWVQVGTDEKHKQLSFVPPSPEEFNEKFPEAIKALDDFRNTKIDGNGALETLLKENKLI